MTLLVPGARFEIERRAGLDREAAGRRSSSGPDTTPGETIYTPSGWWHQTRNEDLCIAVTENFVDETNHEAAMAAAREKHPDEFEWFRLLVEATRAGYRRR